MIILSGYETKDIVEQVSRTEMSTFIEKPFTPDELREAVLSRLVDEAAKGKEIYSVHQ